MLPDGTETNEDEIVLELEDEEVEDAKPEEEPSTPDESTESDTDPDAAEADEKPKQSRAEKRIRGLINQKKKFESEIGQATAYIQQLESQLTEQKTQQTRTEAAYIDEAEDRLDAQLNRAKADYIRAADAADEQAMWEANESLAEVKAEQRNLLNLRANTPNVEEEGAPQPIESQPAQQQPKPDARALSWAKANQDWFIPAGGQDNPLNRRKTATVQVVHADLIEEGYDPADDYDSEWGKEAYFEQVDKRLGAYFKPKAQPDAQPSGGSPVAGTARSPGSTKRGGKNVVRLSATQQQMAKRMGVSLEDYAKQQQIIDQREQS